jgi:hypothetical protein
LTHSTLGSRVIKKEERKERPTRFPDVQIRKVDFYIPSFSVCEIEPVEIEPVPG